MHRSSFLSSFLTSFSPSHDRVCQRVHRKKPFFLPHIIIIMTVFGHPTEEGLCKNFQRTSIRLLPTIAQHSRPRFAFLGRPSRYLMALYLRFWSEGQVCKRIKIHWELWKIMIDWHVQVILATGEQWTGQLFGWSNGQPHSDRHRARVNGFAVDNALGPAYNRTD